MASSLLTPLHLAASLLASFAAAGLAIVVLTRPGVTSPKDAAGADSRLSGVIVAVGAVTFAVGHGLSGALVTELADAAAWLRAGGLALVALGLSGRNVAELSGPAVLLPMPPPAAATVGAVAGALAGLRALMGGWRTALVGVGLLTWGVAEGIAPRSAVAAGWLTLGGSLALGAWVWQASVRRLLAKFVTAFVTSLLVVVVVIAGLLSGVGQADLVDEELRRLHGSADRLAGDVELWPQEAVDAGRPFSTAGETLIGDIPPDAGKETLDKIYRSFFSTQDFFVLVDEEGNIHNAYSPAEGVVTESLRLAVRGSPLVEAALQDRQGGDLLHVGGRVVALGAVPLLGPEPERALFGALVTGRVGDERWVAQAAGRRPGRQPRTPRAEGGAGADFDVLVEVGGEPSAVTQDARPAAEQVLEALSPGAARESLTLGGEVWYAAAAPIHDQSGQPVARVVTLSTADVIAQLARDQVRRLFLLALVGALFAGVVAAVVTGRLVSPIRRLTMAAAAVREGDLEAKTAIATRDEVGQLGRTFNEMTRSLADQSAQLREAADVQSRLLARMEALTSSMGDALVAVDADGKVITFNPAAERLIGRDEAEVLGLPLGEVLRGPAGESAGVSLGDPDSEDVVGTRLLLEHRDGDPVPAAATAAPVRDGTGAVLGRVLVLRDVRREAEIERMKTEFLSNVSHELRTPLTPIKGYADVLARKDVGVEATRRFAGQILASTDRLERIVQMIVDFAALDSGRLRMRREPVWLSDLVAEALQDWRARHPEREFTRRVATALPPVLVDRGMLRRCLDELLENAVKFSPGGERVSVSAKEGGPGMVRLSVRDRGVGIEADKAARIFSEFYQVDASETRHYSGLGLGLALVRRIIDGLGGDASVTSQPGRGTTVHLDVPVAEDPD